jgi:autophagy-related protein 9
MQMELPAMTPLLDDEEDNRVWQPPIRNLDQFFTSMYKFYYMKGLPTIILTQFCDIVSLGFTAVFSSFLIGFVNWHALKSCHDEESCGNVSLYIHNPYAHFSVTRNLFVFVYSVILIAYWGWRTFHSYQIIVDAVEMEQFYRVKMGILTSELNTMQWDDVLQRFIRLHDQGIYRVALKDRITEYDVVARIMRKDNYLVALINQSLLNLKVPWWLSPFVSEKLFLTKSLEWCLAFCITDGMFNEQFTISTLFLRDVGGLEGKFFMVGVINFCLLPVMLIFMTISFFLQNAQQFHSSRAYLGPRQWSPLALWMFREYNELPHVFEERMNRSYPHAVEYLSLFHDVNASVVARCGAYIAGSFVATLLLISVIAEGALLYVLVAEHNLLWWLGIFSALYASARAFVPDDKKAYQSPEDLMTNIAAFTHHFPERWQDNCHTVKVKDEFAELFPYKAKIFALEVTSVLLTPIVLCFSLPSCAGSIIQFVSQHTKYVDGVGSVCDYSAFDFEKYACERFGAVRDGYSDEKQRPRDGKMEQSFINFQQMHPTWHGADAGGRALTERLNVYKSMRLACVFQCAA